VTPGKDLPCGLWHFCKVTGAPRLKSVYFAKKILIPPDIPEK